MIIESSNEITDKEVRKMKIKERTNETIKLDKEMLNAVNGGCWFWGMFGTHSGMVELAIDLPQGTYSKFKCDDCGKTFYMFTDSASGKSKEISKTEFEIVFNAY